MPEVTTERAVRDDSPARPLTRSRRRVRDRILASARLGLRDGATVLISGEAGCGKSVLLEELAGRLDDWTVIRVRADRQEADFPHATLETVLRVAAAASSEPRRPAAVPAGDPARSGRLLLAAFDAFDGPVCLMLDDAQWIDADSAAALRYLARRLAGQPFLLVAASRPGPAGRSAFAGDVPSLAAHHLSVELEPFTERETQSLASELLGYPISRRTAARLTAATSGLPLLVGALVEQLGESISGAQHPAGWDAPLPPSAPVARAVAASLEGADPRAVTAAELIAVLRDPVDAPALGTIADRLSEQIDPDAATDLGLVRAIGQHSVVRYEPAHALFADALAARVPRSRRGAIHRVAAVVLTGSSALRHRIEAATREDEGLARELVVAARESADRDDADTAMDYALSALRLSPGGDWRDRCLLEVALTAMRTRKHERILELIERIEALPESLLRDCALVELRIMRGDVRGSFEAAAVILGSAGDPGAQAPDAPSPDARAVRAHVAGCIPMLQMATRDFRPVIDQVSRARDLLEIAPAKPAEVADPALRWMVRPREDLLWLLGWELTAAAHLERRDVIERASADVDRLAESPRPSAALVDALVTRARAFILTGDLRRARADLERAGTFSTTGQPSWTTGHGRTMLAHVLFLLGDWDQSVAVADTAVATVLDETILTSWPVALASSALVRAARGQEAEVTRRLAAAARTRTVLGSAYDLDLRHIVPAELARALGRPSEQLDAADAGRAAAEGTSTMGWLSYRIDALAALGRAAEARADLALCSAPGTRWRPYYGSYHWLEGRVREAEGALEEARSAYRLAVEDPGAAVCPFPLAIALTDLARLDAACGHHAEALVRLSRAAALFEELGAVPYLARTNAERERLAGERAASRGRGRSPLLEKLTSREREVAGSVAAGMTNKEIAAQLYVSVTTVNFHVRNILAKLELASRHDLRRILQSGRGRDDRSPVNS